MRGGVSGVEMKKCSCGDKALGELEVQSRSGGLASTLSERGVGWFICRVWGFG